MNYGIRQSNISKKALNTAQVPYILQEGEGAFYGPKIEFKFTDSMNREWQCGTLQLDFMMPENFDLAFINSSGAKERPVMIHRAIYGSLERYFAILLEHYRGHLPFWIAPAQIRVMTITQAQQDYATSIAHKLRQAGFRIDTDLSSDQISAKIKAAQLEKIPWMLIIGKKEVENQTVSLRYKDGTQELGLSIDQVLSKAQAAMSE